MRYFSLESNQLQLYFTHQLKECMALATSRKDNFYKAMLVYVVAILEVY